MQIKIGCDIAQIKRFKKLNEQTLKKIFSPNELKNIKPESLAGIFAAKESCKKIFPKLNWLDIEVKKQKTGKPHLIIPKTNMKTDLSISHDGDYAIAFVIAYA